MKKILTLTILVFVLFSCNNTKQDEISKAKDELLNKQEVVLDDSKNEENTDFLTQNTTNSDLDEEIVETNLENNSELKEENIDENQDISQENNEFNQTNSITPNPQIPELKIFENQEFWELTCENIDEFLSTKSSWYYWNTCRKLWENIITLNLLDYKKWDYNYFKYYIDTNRNIFWEVFLQSWTWVLAEELSDLNSKLKDEEFQITTTTNDLFINYKNTNETE